MGKRRVSKYAVVPITIGVLLVTLAWVAPLLDLNLFPGSTFVPTGYCVPLTGAASPANCIYVDINWIGAPSLSAITCTAVGSVTNVPCVTAFPNINPSGNSYYYSLETIGAPATSLAISWGDGTTSTLNPIPMYTSGSTKTSWNVQNCPDSSGGSCDFGPYYVYSCPATDLFCSSGQEVGFVHTYSGQHTITATAIIGGQAVTLAPMAVGVSTTTTQQTTTQGAGSSSIWDAIFTIQNGVGVGGLGSLVLGVGLLVRKR